MSEDVIRTSERNLETELDNKQLQCRQSNATIKELQEELEKLMPKHVFYRLYTAPSRKILLIHQNLVLNPFSFPSEKKLLDNVHDRHLKSE